MQTLKQLVQFPSHSEARRGGLLRERLLLVELDNGKVFFLRLPIHWHPSPERLADLASALCRVDGSHYQRSEAASALSWELETEIELLDFDLASPASANWPLRSAAVEHCMNQAKSGQDSGLAERADAVTRELAVELETALARFTAALDQEVLRLSRLWGSMMSCRYNWFASVQGSRRKYRIQAAEVSPALLGVLSEGNRPPDSRQLALVRAVDCGHRLIEALVETYGVPVAAARHFLRMPANLMGGERIGPVISALGRIAPDLYPRNRSDWETLNQLLSVLPGLTGRPAGSELNLSFLPTIAKGGWDNAETRLREMGADAASRLREFVAAAQGALAWDMMRNGGWRPDEARAAAFAAVDECLGAAGFHVMMRSVRTWPALLSAAQSELADELDLLRGRVWPGVLDQPFCYGSRLVEPLLTHEACVAAGRALSNCVASYAFACAEGKAHVFMIRDQSGRPKGALHLRFTHSSRRGGYSVQIRECKGAGNLAIDAESEGAAYALRDWLLSRTGQERIAAMEKKRMEIRGTDSELKARIEFEPVLMGLSRVRAGSLRLEALREKALSYLKNNPFLR